MTCGRSLRFVRRETPAAGPRIGRSKRERNVGAVPLTEVAGRRRARQVATSLLEPSPDRRTRSMTEEIRQIIEAITEEDVREWREVRA